MRELADQDQLPHLPATGITIYLSNGGVLEKAQMMAAHESPRTTEPPSFLRRTS